MDALAVIGWAFFALLVIGFMGVLPRIIIIDTVTNRKLEEMAKQDNKQGSHFFDDLLHQEWERRNKKQ